MVWGVGVFESGHLRGVGGGGGGGGGNWKFRPSRKFQVTALWLIAAALRVYETGDLK